MTNEITRTIVEVPIEHPLEKVFGIESATTMFPTIERTTQSVVVPSYDDKDKEVEGQFNEVYDAAMGAFETQSQETELVEGKYKARSGEVAVQFLNTALEAAKSKSQQKQHKDKLSTITNKAPGTVNNNLIVADREDLLKNLRNMNLDKDVIDGTIVEG